MSANQVGFIVRHTVQDTSGSAHVLGRCGDQPIRVGDVFEALRMPDRVVNEESSVGAAQSVHLRIVAIQAYQRSLSELGGGMTGTIALEGSGANGLVADAILEPPVRLMAH